MEESCKISVSQLFLLLFLSRGFSVIAFSPSIQGGGERITLITTLLSGIVQYLALTAGLAFCRRGTGSSPLIAPGTVFYRVQCALYCLCAMAVAVYTAVSFLSFMAAAVYDYRYGWLVAVTFGAAGALAVCQGLEGLARGAGILAVLLGLGCVVIALGLWRQYDWLNFSLRLLAPGDTLRGAFHGFAMNGELFAFLLLSEYLRTPPGKGACAGWVGGTTLTAVAVQLLTMLTLGAYGSLRSFPVFTAVTSAGFRSFQRLDSVFLVIWVVLGLVKFTVFLALASGLAPRALFRPWSPGWAWGCGALASAAALALWSGPEHWMEGFYRFVATGALTLLGVLLLPLLGKLLDMGGRKARR